MMPGNAMRPDDRDDAVAIFGPFTQRRSTNSPKSSDNALSNYRSDRATRSNKATEPLMGHHAEARWPLQLKVGDRPRGQHLQPIAVVCLGPHHLSDAPVVD